MIKINYACFSILEVLAMAHLMSILLYLNASIINVKEMATAFPLLVVHILLACMIFLLQWSRRVLYFRLNLLWFLILLAWISLRTVIDLGDLEHLKQITIGTASGMLLFYMLGAFFNMAHVSLREYSREKSLIGFMLIIYLIQVIYLLTNLSSRLQMDIFWIADNFGYQTAGNYLSISFIITSFIFIDLTSSQAGNDKKRVSFYFWTMLFSLITVLVLISSQMLGSNSATAVVIGVYILTTITVMLARNRKLQLLHAEGKIAVPESKYVMRVLIRNGVVALSAITSILAMLILATDFDIASIRLFGFGEGANISLSSRTDILIQTGADQIGYAPLLGNMNVAFLVTGDAGITLHAFFPFILANLGLLGLLIVFSLFFIVFRQLYIDIKNESRLSPFINKFIVKMYSLFILLFLLIFANISVGVEWPVIWFAVGLVSNPFGFRSIEKSNANLLFYG